MLKPRWNYLLLIAMLLFPVVAATQPDKAVFVAVQSRVDNGVIESELGSALFQAVKDKFPCSY
jgi:hypothetical protein